MRAATLFVLSAIAAASTLAHEGHGAPNPHLHGWDGVGLTLLAAATGAAVWWLWKGRK